MKTTQVTQELVAQTISKNRAIMQDLHDRLINNNPEMYNYLLSKGELNDFLIKRTDAAHYALSNADSDLMNTQEFKYLELNKGLENSISEYVESLINEFPQIVVKFNDSPKRDLILQNLITASVPIFYKYLSVPYSESQSKLDVELLQTLEIELLSISL